jgi:hypothetical protein
VDTMSQGSGGNSQGSGAAQLAMSTPGDAVTGPGQ